MVVRAQLQGSGLSAACAKHDGKGLACLGCRHGCLVDSLLACRGGATHRRGFLQPLTEAIQVCRTCDMRPSLDSLDSSTQASTHLVMWLACCAAPAKRGHPLCKRQQVTRDGTRHGNTVLQHQWRFQHRIMEGRGIRAGVASGSQRCKAAPVARRGTLVGGSC